MANPNDPAIVTVIVHAPYHSQDGDLNCSAAIAQMLLASESIGAVSIFPQWIEGAMCDQQPLLNVINVSKEPWWEYGGPKGLQNALNMKKPAAYTASFQPTARTPLLGYSFAAPFAANYDASALTGYRRITLSLTGRRIAVPAAVFDYTHWVLVVGVQLQQTPGGAPVVLGFFYHNPVPVTPSRVDDSGVLPPPPPHYQNDACGSPASTYASLAGWLQNEWGNVTTERVPVALFVTVTTVPDAMDIADTVDLPGPNGLPQLNAGRAAGELAASAEQETMNIDAGHAIRAALAGIRVNGLDRSGPYAAVLGGGELIAREPLRVDRLDAPGAYYLVQLDRVDEQTRLPVRAGYAQIDAAGGTFLGFDAPHPGARSPVVDPAAALAAVAELTAETTRWYSLNARTRYVWKSSTASRSPYYPLFAVQTNDETTYYVTYDLNVYRSLEV